jgi:ATP-dependent Clp protease ATP-binding subunit ClpC
VNQLTRRAEQILKLAKEAAAEENRGFVGTEHLLLAIMREGTGLGARVLAEHGVTEARVREQVEELNHDRLNETWVMGRLPGTPNFMDVLSRAVEAARGAGNWQICSIHLLVGLLTLRESTGGKVLRALGVTGETVRKGLAQAATVKA